MTGLIYIMVQTSFLASAPFGTFLRQRNRKNHRSLCSPLATAIISSILVSRKSGVFVLAKTISAIMTTIEAEMILKAYDDLTREISWYDWTKLLDGFDDENETYDLTVLQPRLDAVLEEMRPDQVAFRKWKWTVLIPICNFTMNWFPSVAKSRGLKETEYIWHERHFSFLKLAVIYLRMERFNWRLISGNENREPSVDDLPLQVDCFCHEACYWASIDGKNHGRK